MSASFPATIKNFLQLQDGVDRVIAQHPNERGDEVTAIETMIGAIGSSQSYSESIKNLLLAYRRGSKIDYKSTSDLYVRSGEMAISDVGGNVRFRRNTSDSTINWTNLDTGSEANSTRYYIYACADSSGTTFTIKISASASSPSGSTFYKLLGSFYNNSSGNIEDIRDGLVPEIPSIINYGSSSSSGTTLIPGQIKICFGTISMSGETTTVSGLPFSSAASYVVVVTSVSGSHYINAESKTASSFALRSSTGGADTACWFAIGY